MFLLKLFGGVSLEGRSTPVPHCTYGYRELRDELRVREIVRRIGFPE